MSRKTKFSKLQIPKCSRNDSTSHSTVTKFFTQTNHSEIEELKAIDNIKLKTPQSKDETKTDNSNFTTINQLQEIENHSNIKPDLNRCSSSNQIPEKENPYSKFSINNGGGALHQNSNEEKLLQCLESDYETSTSVLKRKTSNNRSSNNKNKKTTITKFFDESADGDFATPPAKQQKKTMKSSKCNNNNGQIQKKRKRQPKINSILLRDEMMFSKMITKQSIAENVNPDDMQLALALSRSEIEIIHDDEGNNSEQQHSISQDSPLNVKKRLKKFEYKTTARSGGHNRGGNDFDFPLFVANKSKRKWANRFTPLTLRNPEKQAQKLNANLDILLNKQTMLTAAVNTAIATNPDVKDENEFNVTSSFLLDLIVSSNENKITNKNSLNSDNPLNDNNNDDIKRNYYVKNLLSPNIAAAAKPGYLLKDYKKIPGRDLSPISLKMSNNNMSSTSNENSNQNQMRIKDDNDTERIQNNFRSSLDIESCPSSSKLITDDNNDCDCKQIDERLLMNNYFRETSPDLFADYDEDYATNEDDNSIAATREVTVKEGKENSANDLHSYEKFSSDDDVAKLSSFSVVAAPDDDKSYKCTNNTTQMDHFSPNLSSNFECVADTKNEIHYDDNKTSDDCNLRTNSSNHLDIIDLTQEDKFSPEKRNKNNFIEDLMKNNANESLSPIDSYNSFIAEEVENEDNSVIFIEENENFTHFSSSEMKLKHKYSSSNVSDNETADGLNKNCNHDKLKNSLNSFRKECNVNETGYAGTLTTKNSSGNMDSNENNNYSQSSEVSDCCVIVLSDDEVNYSIRKTNRIFESNIADEDDDSDDISTATNCSREGRNLSSTSIANNDNKARTQKHSKSMNNSKVHNFSLIDLISEKNLNNLQLQAEDDDDDDDSENVVIITQEANINATIKPETTKAVNIDDDDIFDPEDLRLRDDEIPLDAVDIIDEDEQLMMFTPIQKFNDDDSFDIEKIKAQFGILDERTPIKIIHKQQNKNSQLHESANMKKSKLLKKSLSESVLKQSSSSSPDADDDDCNDNKIKNEIRKSLKFKRFSSTTSNKLNEFIDENEEKLEDFYNFDEFDKMVYGNPLKENEPIMARTYLSPKRPQGIEKLLTAEISFKGGNNSKSNLTSSSPVADTISATVEEVTYDNKVYLVRTDNIPEKPDFRNMNTPTRLKELYKYGLKPLKKKQAIIMLEYIFNQTHPFILDDDNHRSSEKEKFTTDDNHQIIQMHDVNTNHKMNQDKQKQTLFPDEKQTNLQNERNEGKCNNLNFKDCFGDILLREDEILPEIIDEEFYFPTNVRSKVLTAVLPLHVAWFNLVKSSNHLRELLLHYEPIDLQEIYIFFKKLGYRYNPKDMKKFFDSRSIIFRYDLSDGTNNRHTRKLLPKNSR